jgi:hypothetical protein
MYLFQYIGIKHRSILFDLQSIEFPQSFPTDIMHLFFQNVAGLMYQHWTGEFKKKGENAEEILSSLEPYQLSKKTWEEIGQQMADAKREMPVDFGRPPRDIFKYHNGFKAVEWRNWIILFSLPLLKDKLPKKYQF